ncbi:MAG: YkgJ family cysteine cluster protein [Oligoflexia bacterium]|nr:YkgJ family cysteine cluster protein [Oligoflexia bacterium]
MNQTCLQCINQNLSCCHHPRIIVTYEEICFFKKQGYKIEDVIMARKYCDEESFILDWKEYAVFRKNGENYEICIKKNKDSSCVFLTAHGCSLKENRPLGCQIYPFWVVENSVIFDSCNDFKCLLSSFDIHHMLAIIGETEKSIRLYYSKFKNSMIKHKEILAKILPMLSQT